MRALLDITVAFLISLLAGMGVGTGGLLVVYLTAGERMSQLTAQGVNLVFYLAAAIPSAFLQIKRKKLPVKEITVASVSGLAGAFVGFFMSDSFKPDIIKRIFGAILAISGIIAAVGLLKSNKNENNLKK